MSVAICTLSSNYESMKKWNSWQKELLDEISIPCNDDRKVIWYFDPAENNGQEILLTNLSSCVKYTWNPQIKIESIVNKIQEHIKSGKEVDVIIFDLVQSDPEDFPNLYDCINWCKWGLFPQQKDQQTQLAIKPPHVVILSNNLPNFSRLPPDQWNIRLLKNNESVPFPKFVDDSDDQEVRMTFGQRYLRIKPASEPAYFLPYSEVLPSKKLNRLCPGMTPGDVIPTLIREAFQTFTQGSMKCTLELLREQIARELLL